MELSKICILAILFGGIFGSIDSEDLKLGVDLKSGKNKMIYLLTNGSFNQNNMTTCSQFVNETVDWYCFQPSYDRFNLSLILAYKNQDDKKIIQALRIEMSKLDYRQFDHQMAMKYGKGIELTSIKSNNTFVGKPIDRRVLYFKRPMTVALKFFLKYKSKRVKLELNSVFIVLKPKLDYDHQMDVIIRNTKDLEFNETKFIEFFKKELDNPFVIINETLKNFTSNDQMKISIASHLGFSIKTFAFVRCNWYPNLIKETEASIIGTFGERFYKLYKLNDCPIFLHSIQNPKSNDSFQSPLILYFTINHSAIRSLSNFWIVVLIILQLVLNLTDKSILI